MKVITCLIMLFILISTSSYAADKFTLTPQEGAYLSYYKNGNSFKNETTRYNYIYDIAIEKDKGTCRIAAIPEAYKKTFPAIYFNGYIIKTSDDLLVVSKNPENNDPYQELYFIYPKLKVGFMVIGKANDGFPDTKSAFPSASLAAIPLTIQ